MRQSRVLCVLLVCCFLSLGSDQSAYAGEFGPLRGKIVDAETKEPVEGVVVLVEWRETHFFAGSTFIDAQETLTDKEGNFHIPGIWVLNPLKRATTDTNMTIYKSGYEAIETWAFRDWKQINPMLPYVLRLEEDGNPVIMLRKLTNEERKKLSTPGTETLPYAKKKLLLEEINKENRFRGLGEEGPVRR